MLHIKVFQGGATRIYNANSFKLGTGQNEFYNFLEVVTNVDLGHKKNICLEDVVTGATVFISPVSCLIEVEEVADE